LAEWERTNRRVVGGRIGGALSWDADWGEGRPFRRWHRAFGRWHERSCGCGGDGRDGVVGLGGRRLDGCVGNVGAVSGLGLELAIGVVVVELLGDAVLRARRAGDDYGGFP
jgi:hypothetical protein